jgi:hypothetical protein
MPGSKSSCVRRYTQHRLRTASTCGSASTPLQPGTMVGYSAYTADNTSQATANAQSASASTVTGNTMRLHTRAPPSPGQSTTSSGTAPSSGQSGGASVYSSHSGHPAPPHSGADPDGNSERWARLANAMIARANAHVLPYRGRRIHSVAAQSMWRKANETLDVLFNIFEHCTAMVTFMM